ncbi:DNA-directed RNA polymerase I subunit RPA1 [Tetranychus urticae]|uniref:DNA-directed RNA polymerase subunit n=1 Tax=Tetranychus urticae TaxID=32264 RepID=T1JVI2_TETUR|nr:DNA-directed RNA polymerase I subunit RPA1 [Tetranychus urticae]
MNISLLSQFSLATVSFKPYSRQELKKSSVLEVTNPVSFDALGHPTKGGLHDPVLGPSRRDDICETCNLGGHGKDECPGHFGHISLPVPIYNPFFIRQMFQMLSMCCFSCHHLLFHPANLQVVLYQLQALDYGLDYLVDELQSVANDLSNIKSDKGPEFIDFLKAKLSECIENALKQNSTNSKNDVSQVRNVIDRKQNLMKALLQGKLVKIIKNCAHCNNKKFNMSLVNNSMVLMSQPKSLPKHYGFTASNETPETSGSVLKDKVQEVDSSGKSFLTPLVARDHLRQLYKNETETLKRMLKLIHTEEGLEDALEGDDSAIDVFFMDMIPVTPPRFRPLHMMGGKSYEDETTTMLTQVILASEGLKNSLKSLQNLDQTSVKEKTQEMTKLHSAWGRLQILCNRIYDSEMDKLPEKKAPGVRQILEKKEGLFRKNMMGKRVNYAARSVISPDPYISVDEIGIPEIFATRLSYPQPVTPWNVEVMKKAVINGPDIHPGALSVTLEDGSVMRLRANDPEQRARIANLLGQHKPGSRTVNRHLINGDILLLNRQPTLHKPSIMAHKARVLKREKTLRLHYSNCKCYNADFDGDEMNAHFPQSELARSEAYNIVSVNKQYLVPKDGSPLGGLIQDHIVSATLLTMKGNFFNRKDYQQLVFSALFNQKTPIKLVKPTIWRPVPLWSGKQIITTLIINLVPPDKTPPTLYISSKVNSKTLSSGNFRDITVSKYYTPEELDDSTVIIRQGEVLQGLIDKANIGPTPYGLIHICYELYGGEVSNSLLTAIARLCTVYLQVHGGVTLGIEDIIVNENADRKRSEIIRASTTVGDEAATQAVGLPITCEKSVLVKRLREWHASQDPVLMKTLDSCMKSKTDEVNDGITKVCLPAGLIKKFPHNNLQLMIQSGAKGGTVNALQISCLLGQIELEGKRVPLMMSGRTLPSFVPYDTSPKAGGFVTGRFLTGIRPQEFFFHCMAGREGLIDTAVKTSRSGYLQRCLIKHLEGLTVQYDSTVRDIDGSLVQLQYGEDGIDVLKSQLLKPKAMPLLIHNRAVLMPTDEELSRLQLSPDILAKIEEYRQNISDWEEINEMDRLKRRIGSGFQEYFEVKLRDYKNNLPESVGPTELSQEDYSTIIDSWFQLSKNDKRQLNFYFLPCPGPLSIDFRPNHHFGVLPEKMEYQIQNYVKSSPDGLVFDPSVDVGDESWKGKQIVTITELKNLINSRFMKSLADPGESVGLLAAQSIGEPSTQMTLNTFHFAGRGDMNVTLGIPRLREILMTASPKIATPNMDIPFRSDFDENRIDAVRKRMSSVKLCDVLETIDVKEILTINEKTCARYYDIVFKFLPYQTYKKKFNAKPAKILSYMESTFIKNLINAIKRAQIIQRKYNSLYDHSMHHREAKGGDENEGAPSAPTRENPDAVSSDEEDNAVEEDTHAVRTKAHRNQELDYEEPEEEEIEANKEPEEDQTDNITTLEPDEEVHPKVDEDEELQQQNEQESAESQKEKQPETNERQDDDWNPLLTKTLEKEKKEKEMLAKKALTESLVKEKSSFIDLYDYDEVKKEWCRVVLKFPLNTDKVDIASIVEEEARKSYIFKIGSIDKVFLVEDREASKRGVSHGKMIKTEGVGFFDLVNMQSIFDLNRVYSNDIHAIANTYGIEAARKAITIEIANVFAVYGIEVDPRHLSLIADYMTFNGTIKGMNRISMAGSSSPLQQMTFETTAAFLKSALLLDFKDELKSPSARIFAGRPPLVGTGILGLMQDGTVEYKPSQHLRFKNIKNDSKISPKSGRKFGPRNRTSNRFGNLKRKHQSPNISIEKPLNKRTKFD